MCACLLAPVLASAVISAGLFIWAAVGAAPDLEAILGLSKTYLPLFVVLAIYVTAIATPAMIVLGLPFQYWLAKSGWNAWWYVTLPAFLVGSFAGAVLLSTVGFLFGGVIGGLSGFFAWLIRRPDRDHMFDHGAKALKT